MNSLGIYTNVIAIQWVDNIRRHRYADTRNLRLPDAKITQLSHPGPDVSEPRERKWWSWATLSTVQHGYGTVGIRQYRPSSIWLARGVSVAGVGVSDAMQCNSARSALNTASYED